MHFLSSIKARVPDYAKDIRLNLDGTIARSSLEGNDAVGVALAAAFAAKSTVIVDAIRNAGVLSPEETQGALTAAALMGMNNVWYPYVEMTESADLKSQPGQLRMNAYASHGGSTSGASRCMRWRHRLLASAISASSRISTCSGMKACPRSSCVMSAGLRP